MGGDGNVGGRLLDDRHVECGAVPKVFLQLQCEASVVVR